MNRQAVAAELLAIASALVEADSDLPHLELKQLDREAGVFPSQKALQDYMREHPDAKRGQHKVNYREWKRKYRD
jgi:hypothetical protein